MGDKRDLTEAEGQLGAVTSSTTGRIAWVTKGRTIIERFDVVVAGAVGVNPPTQLAFAALVAAVLSFVAFQVWDGFADVGTLV